MTTSSLDSAMQPDAGAETFANTRPAPPERLASIDAYRGLVMFLMMAEALRLRQVADRLPGNRFWELLRHHQSHVEWVGCSLHDLIQPSFSFLVGVALPYSVAGRLARGQSKTRITMHALWRSVLLVFLGVFLRSLNSSQTNYTFEDTLSQIGLGYTFLFVLALQSRRVQWIALALILIGYWGAFALYRIPGPEFDFNAVGVPPDWPHHPVGFAKHWDKNSNLAWAFDTRLLNLFPREKPFTHNQGGYATLSFIPTLATMILGLLAGGILRRTGPSRGKVQWLAVAGCISLAAGWGLCEAGLCPVVKRIWTPSWVLYSGGWCFLFLAAFYAVLDVVKLRFWAFPLQVIGMNSIAAYCMADICQPFITHNLTTHLGTKLFTVAGHAFEPLLRGAGVLLVLWLILFWMYRRKLFLRI
jgi:heparan-alpha-glucosaminide N-acetyltransferase